MFNETISSDDDLSTASADFVTMFSFEEYKTV
jgi:hypothetical protein